MVLSRDGREGRKLQGAEERPLSTTRFRYCLYYLHPIPNPPFGHRSQVPLNLIHFMIWPPFPTAYTREGSGHIVRCGSTSYEKDDNLVDTLSRDK